MKEEKPLILLFQLMANTCLFNLQEQLIRLEWDMDYYYINLSKRSSGNRIIVVWFKWKKITLNTIRIANTNLNMTFFIKPSIFINWISFDKRASN